MAARCSIPLPGNYRTGDFLQFYRRDKQETAEQVHENQVRKGLSWRGSPACLQLDFNRDRVDAMLIIDGESGGDNTGFEALVRRMLGLTQPVEEFENRFRGHPLLGPVLQRQAGLRVPVTATPFEALTWAITGQQISVGAATAIRRKLILSAGIKHSSGLYCYPCETGIAAMNRTHLRATGLSTAKADTLYLLAREIVKGRLCLALPSTTQTMAELASDLNSLRGIGPWTTNYTLLRGYGWLDGSLEGDVAVRRGLQRLLGEDHLPSAKETGGWLETFAPWRALAAAHLWANQTATAGRSG